MSKAATKRKRRSNKDDSEQRARTIKRLRHDLFIDEKEQTNSSSTARIWRDVSEYPSYELSTDGIIRRKDDQRKLSLMSGGGSYLLTRDGKQRSVSIRSLMLSTFPETFTSAVEWVDIPEVPTHQVCRQGHIRRKSDFHVLTARDNNGYREFDAWEGKTCKCVRIHQAVLTTFGPARPSEKHTPNHKNLDRADNRIENLEWSTRSEQQKHRYVHGHRGQQGRSVHQLSLEGEHIKTHESISAAARATNSQPKCITLVCTGKMKKTNGFSWAYATEPKPLPASTMTDEEWKEIATEQGYQISTFGRVRNPRGRMMSTKPRTDGYVPLVISHNKRSNNYLMHILVASTFIPNDDRTVRNEVDHKDGNRSNNAVTNLEWVTHKENAARAIGKSVEKLDSKTQAVVATYQTVKEAAKDAKYGPSAMSCILKGKIVHRDPAFVWRYAEALRRNATTTKDEMRNTSEIDVLMHNVVG